MRCRTSTSARAPRPRTSRSARGRERQHRLRLRRVLRGHVGGRLEGLDQDRRGADLRRHGHVRRRLPGVGRRHHPDLDRPERRQRRRGAFFDGASQDGSRVFIDTIESLAPADTDSSYDIYELSGGQTTLLSTGPSGGNGAFFAAFRRATPDGSHVYFESSSSSRPLTRTPTRTSTSARVGSRRWSRRGPAAATGTSRRSTRGARPTAQHVFFGSAESTRRDRHRRDARHYERFAGDTTLISTGPILERRAARPVRRSLGRRLARVLRDGGAARGDTTRIPPRTSTARRRSAFIARPKGATPLRVPLVPAFQQCSAPEQLARRSARVRLVQAADAGFRLPHDRLAGRERQGRQLVGLRQVRRGPGQLQHAGRRGRHEDHRLARRTCARSPI